MGSEHYCLRWNNHQNNLLGVFSQLLQEESLVDVTLACSEEGRLIRAHKVVLSACSAYFKALFLDHPTRHPIVVLKDVQFAELRDLVEFMYRGEVNVDHRQLSTLLKTAESLKVKGLADMARPSDAADDSVSDHVEMVAADRDDDEPEDLRPTSRCRTPEVGSRTPELKTRTPVLESRTPSPPPTESDDNLSMQSEPSDMTTVDRQERLSSPPSFGLPPVQQAPLFLKKEAECDKTDDRSAQGESSLDYRNIPDPEVCLVEGVFNTLAAYRSQVSVLQQRFSAFSQFPASLPPVYNAETSVSLYSVLQQQGLIGPCVSSSDEVASRCLIRCAICLAGFPSTWLLEQHTALQHTGQPVRGHGGDGGDEKPFQCEQCGQNYRYRSAYLKHREQNHRARLPADKLFTCDICGMQFRYLKSFKKHRLNHALERLHRDTTAHGGDESRDVPRTPTSAEAQVTSTNEVVSIEAAQSSAASSPVPKSGSAKVLSSSSSSSPSPLSVLKSNAQRTASAASAPAVTDGVANGTANSNNNVKSFACPFCGKCVRSKENLKLHVRKHTGERPFACLFCGRAFGGKSDLTRHLRIHTGERPYHCEMCGKCFARADYLSKHLTTHIHNNHQR
ncbi:GDNF-inducible zinc finger protein 1-like [Adelges cooleyi]|uniref:GDNF-inducible zinc finger protein 1-like n=1 Tax=Adelges cooleyi TaxID=133065 RepID=UPI00218042AE|nr:GDNF-inducible zinc finger protein 1-like [Adelges cooleyi]XP_050440999.1 GDNF-inducible zinc finger protein 1-like [Adelges cooleyi]